MSTVGGDVARPLSAGSRQEAGTLNPPSPSPRCISHGLCQVWAAHRMTVNLYGPQNLPSDERTRLPVTLLNCITRAVLDKALRMCLVEPLMRSSAGLWLLARCRPAGESRDPATRPADFSWQNSEPDLIDKVAPRRTSRPGPCRFAHVLCGRSDTVRANADQRGGLCVHPQQTQGEMPAPGRRGKLCPILSHHLLKTELCAQQW